MKIAIDVDGVLANFMQGVRNYYRCELEEPDTWDSFLPLHIKEEDFWRGHYTQREFYTEVPIYSWALDLIEIVKSFSDDYYLLSSCSGLFPMMHKAWWIDQNIGEIKTVLLTEGDKLDYSFDILIDDKPSLFGNPRVITFPQNYNEGGNTKARGSSSLEFYQKEFVYAKLKSELKTRVKKIQDNKPKYSL